MQCPSRAAEDADSTGARDAAPAADTAGTARAAARQESRFAKPRWVMLRSLVVPGWGQAYNRQWIKAVAVAGAEGYMLYRVIGDQQDLRALEGDIDAAREAGDLELEDAAVTAYNDLLSASVGRQWLLGGIVVYALIDAYVDAHFRHFKVEFERDPALPEGPPDDPGVRVRWEWSF